jgi:hypothetical protein
MHVTLFLDRGLKISKGDFFNPSYKYFVFDKVRGRNTSFAPN